MADAYKNFALSAVATAPSPAISGTSLVVTAGHGARFPTPPFNATVWLPGTLPDPTTAEIVRVTAISTDTLTVTRAQESTTARTITVGDFVAATITKQLLDELHIPLDLATEVTGDLPLANLAPMAAASTLLGRGDSGAGDLEPITLGAGLTMTGTSLAASGGGGGATDARLIVVVKSANQTVNNSAALQNDTHLAFAVAANTTYLVDCYLLLNGGITADFKFGWSLPAGATLVWAPEGEGGGGGVSPYWAPKSVGSGSVPALSGTAIAVNGNTSIPYGIHLTALLLIGSTAGTATLQWAQNTATVADTIVLANSLLRAVTS